MRSGLRAVLEGRAGWEVVAEAHNGKEAVARVIEKQPDVAIVDYSMPFMTGVEVARRIRKRQLATEILIFTMHDFKSSRVAGIPGGCPCIRAEVRYEQDAHGGRRVIDASQAILRWNLFERTGGYPGQNERPGPDAFASRETIVKLVAEGHSNKAVSAILDLSIKTTETHRAAAMRKLNINSTAGLVRYAVRTKLVEA